MKKIILFMVLISALGLTACQNSNAPAANSNSSADKTPQIIVPTLALKTVGGSSDFQLRSQTSTYLNKGKTKVELILTDDPEHACLKPATSVNENQTLYKLTIDTGTSQPFATGENYSNLSLTKLTKDGEAKIALTPASSVKLSAINNSIFRGNLDLQSDGFSLQGEFFTALCK